MDGDVYRFINDLDATAIDQIAQRLEFRGTDPGYTRFREACFTKLPLQHAQRVLALGCGTGVEARALMRQSDFHGYVIGVDLSPELLERARRLTVEEGLAEGVEYQVGDAHNLDFADASFDLVLAHTLLSHVTAPLTVLHEAARVVKPDGIVAIFDGDYASLTFSHPDQDLARRVEELVQAVLVQHPRVMRDLPRLLRDAGLELVEVLAHTYADVGTGGFFANVAASYAPILTRSGLLPAEEIARWRAGLDEALAERTFFAACNFYTYLVRPATAEPAA